MDKNKQMEIESAVFKKMVKHFQERTDVQNIDVMEANIFRGLFATIQKKLKQ